MNSRKIKTIGIGIVLFLLLFFFGYHCPFQILTGLPCPGCNMTTSLYYLLKGNVHASFFYHALLIPTIMTVILCLLFRKNQKIIKWILIVWCSVMIVYYIYRMIAIFPNAPMYYDQTSILHKMYELLCI